jgi:hypothetical protein
MTTRFSGAQARLRLHPRAALFVGALLCALALLLAWAMLAPLPGGSRERIFEIPPGTYQSRMGGKAVAILPAEIRLTLGVQDILVLKNADEVPQIFGPVLIMPGQSFKLPFHKASDYQFECSAHASGQMTVIVAPEPIPGWRRLAWRVQALAERMHL